LQEKILAAPESPANQTKGGRYSSKNLTKATVNAARAKLEGLDSMSVYGMSDADVLNAAKVKGVYGEARSEAKRGIASNPDSYEFEKSAPTKQTKAGKIAADAAKFGLSAANAIMSGSKLGQQAVEMIATGNTKRKAKKAAKKEAMKKAAIEKATKK
jgi:hypothetical protein